MAAHRRPDRMHKQPPGDPQSVGALQHAVHQAVVGAGLTADEMAHAQLVSASVTYAITDQDGMSRTVTIPMSFSTA